MIPRCEREQPSAAKTHLCHKKTYECSQNSKTFIAPILIAPIAALAPRPGPPRPSSSCRATTPAPCRPYHTPQVLPAAALPPKTEKTPPVFTRGQVVPPSCCTLTEHVSSRRAVVAAIAQAATNATSSSLARNTLPLSLVLSQHARCTCRHGGAASRCPLFKRQPENTSPALTAQRSLSLHSSPSTSSCPSAPGTRPRERHSHVARKTPRK